MSKDKQQFHIMGTSVAEWKTSEDIHEVIRFMDKGGFTYSLFYIPLPFDAEYEIKFYVPQVDGAIYLGTKEIKR